MARDTERKVDYIGIQSGSDGDGSDGYDSEANEIRKGGRSLKRRRLSHDSDDDGSGSEFDSDDGKQESGKKEDKAGLLADTASHGGDIEGDIEGGDDLDNNEGLSKSADGATTGKPVLPELTEAHPLRRNLVTTDEAVRRSGVLYLSRIPPFMKASKLRSLLSPYGTINRIFLAPEDPRSHARRVRSGGNKKRMFVEGWVEFVSKKDAKRCAELLNARTIGGPRKSYYRDDVWCMLYLKGFKWRHLTAQIAAEAAEREARLRAEISRVRREDREFLAGVEKAKVEEGIRKTREAREEKRKRLAAEGGEGQSADDDDGAGKPVSEAPAGREEKRRRTFKQKEPARKKVDEPSDLTTRVLSSIF